jgi:hypothetical protein
MIGNRVILAAFAAAILAAPASAERAARGITDVTAIHDGSGHARLLFHWDPAVDAESFAIRRAILKFDLAGDTEARSLEIRVHPLSVPWDASTVTWTRGWTVPGGDFDADRLSNSRIELGRGAGPVAVDVTNVVKEILEEKEPFHGFLVTAHPAEGVGLRGQDLFRFAGLTNASLELSWRKVPPKPRALR